MTDNPNNPVADGEDELRKQITRLVTDMTVAKELSEESLIDYLIELIEVYEHAAEMAGYETAYQKVAKQIWEDEQKAHKALEGQDPTSSSYTHLCGRIVGLQRARDIAEQQKGYEDGKQAKIYDPKP